MRNALPLPLRLLILTSAALLLALGLTACSSAGRRCPPPTSGSVVVNVYASKADLPRADAPIPTAPAREACPGGVCAVPTPFQAVAFQAEGEVGVLGAAGPSLPVATPRGEPGPDLRWPFYVGCSLILLAVLLGLRRASRLGLALALCTLGLPLAGCRVADAIGQSMPASSGYVDELHGAQDKAIADLRTHVDDADAKIRVDMSAADAAGKAAFDQAIAEGKTIPEAVVAQIVAKAESAQSAAQKATEAAEGARTAAADSASKAVADAKAAAQKEAEGSTPLWASLLGLLGGGGGLALVLRRMLSTYDAKPFVGADGKTLAEADLVKAASSLLSAAGAKPAA